MHNACYDTIVVGAGIAGLSTAWWLTAFGQKVLLVDKKGLLAGASGAAGAFLSPRLGRGGPLQRVTDDAYRFALDFYAKETPEHFFQKGLVRLPKNEEDAARFADFETFIDVTYRGVLPDDFPHISPQAKAWGGFFFPDAAFVDPMGVAKTLAKAFDTRWGVDARPLFKEGAWQVGGAKAERLVLATGAQRLPLEIPYFTIGGVWGERVDLQTDAEIPVTLHQKLSVSANVKGIVRVGATHVRDDTRSEIERVNALVTDAMALVPSLKESRLVRIYAGHRASVSDHFPLVGPVADFTAAKARLKTPPKSLKPGDAAIPRIPGLFIVNGFGGRGFVFGPLMGKIAAEAVLGQGVPDASIHADRYLLRRLRKG
ncbi:FAD-dependent oxidoreductase [Hydrogenimonas sp. SS33]|uniref:NAD(P)/FAD-dependent oxidoreductase n=1 Tax=Hydrogenimonas leucolamina TaxID=2954236 RepID=UPI00336BF91A